MKRNGGSRGWLWSGAATVLWCCALVNGQTVGDPMPAWSPGTLDIHHISTGRGNSTFFVLPDGTTLLVDAGALEGSSPRYAAARPDQSRPPGEWLARYIRHFIGADGEIDYAMLTHFHADHMGQPVEKSPVSKTGPYKLSGITEVGDTIRIRKMLDRGWPDYQYPAPLDNENMKNYRNFLSSQIERNGMKVERFTPGRADQIVLVKRPQEYDNFEIRNLMANGEIWTGVGTQTRHHIPPLEILQKGDLPSENMVSAGFRLSYGGFDYYTGGDLPGVLTEGYPEWQDLETPVAKAVGPVEVAILNHHGYIDSMNEFFVGALQARVWILFVWDSAHPTARVYSRLQSKRIYPGLRDIFATNMHEANRTVVVGLDKLASDRGHVVIRVSPGGASYLVFTLDDSAETFQITSVHGPYESR